jgi:hypothetical protein
VGLIPPNCPSNIFTRRLAPASGLAAGNIDGGPDVEIVAVLDEPNTSNHKQLVYFNLVGSTLNVKRCTAPLPVGDVIPGTSAPAIAQMDGPQSSSSGRSEVIIDNKVFDAQGNLRYTGFSNGGNCAGAGGPPCPRSRTAIVAAAIGPSMLPQMITGKGLYRSSLNLPTSLWAGTLVWNNSNITNASPSLVYPAIAEIVGTSPGPEIVVTDTMQTTVRVLSSTNGVQLASAVLPNSGLSKCGGPPMIADTDGFPGAEIGVAGCFSYTVFQYNGTSTLQQLWTRTTSDPSGQTTSTFFANPTGRRIFYADQNKLWVFNAANGNVIQQLSNSSSTAIEGPAIAALDNAVNARGVLILAANNYLVGANKGVRLFTENATPILMGPTKSFWNEHTYHVTNIINSMGAIPTVEPASWASTLNAYRVQR